MENQITEEAPEIVEAEAPPVFRCERERQWYKARSRSKVINKLLDQWEAAKADGDQKAIGGIEAMLQKRVKIEVDKNPTKV